jgi:GxxExxY protein
LESVVEMEYSSASSTDRLTGAIIGCAIEVHRTLGPGLLESTYEVCLASELQRAGLVFETQVPIPIVYKGEELPCGFRADLIVESRVLVELKSVDRFLPIHDSQLLTYLKLCSLHVGLLINFNAQPLRNGIRRLVR